MAQLTTIHPTDLLKVLLMAAVSILWTWRLGLLTGTERIFYWQLVLTFIKESICATYSSFFLQNGWLYNLSLPLETALLALFAHRTIRTIWSGWVCGTVVLVLVLSTLHEFLQPVPVDVLHARSTIFGWAFLTLIFCYLLVGLAERSPLPPWRDPLFWTYLSIVVFSGPAIPYVGLINRLAEQGSTLALDLYIILDVLFFLSWLMLLIAALLLPQRKPAR